MTDQKDASAETIALTTDIIAAYVTKNNISASDLPSLIVEVHGALLKASAGPAAAPIAAPAPAVPVKKSITPDYLISLEDGRRYKSLKRHLGLKGMSPDEYRTKWKLPGDYPMVSANYSAARSSLAKNAGVGGGIRGAAKSAPEPIAEKAPARRRAKKSA